MSGIQEIVAHVGRMRERQAPRDAAMAKLAQVRRGDMDAVMPDVFSDEFPKSIAANFIDVAARDTSELMAPLPTLQVYDESAASSRQKSFTSRKTNIGYGYWDASNLQAQMYTACDWYISCGYLPLLAEADYERQTPVIYAVDPQGSYYTLDRRGDCAVFASVVTASKDELVALFPEHETQIRTPPTDQYGNTRKDDGDLEVIRYYDGKRTLCYLPGRQNFVLADIPNRVGTCPVVIVERPGLGGPRGQFDDAIPVQIARAMMARYGLEAAADAVNAQLALPDDVQTLAIGPKGILRSRTPEKIRRVGTEISPAAFQTEQTLEAELRKGLRYPDSRSGEIDASIITGRGVQALQGTLDTQIKTAQTLLGLGLKKITSKCYEIDEKTWPNLERTVRASIGGVSFIEKYTPSKDIKGDYRCDTVYGFAAGLGVNQAVVMIEQMINGGLISRAVGRRHLSLGEDPVKLEREVSTQQLRDGFIQGITATAQSANVVLEQGGDPTPVLAKVANVIKAVGKGDAIEDAFLEAFKEPEAPPGAGPNQPGTPGEGAPMGMSDTTGLPMNVAQAGQGPGGRPPLQMLLAGLTSSGKANLQDSIARRVPALG